MKPFCWSYNFCPYPFLYNYKQAPTVTSIRCALNTFNIIYSVIKAAKKQKSF